MNPEHRAALEGIATDLRALGPLHSQVADCLMEDARADDTASARTRLVGIAMALGLGARPRKAHQGLRQAATHLAEALGRAK